MSITVDHIIKQISQLTVYSNDSNKLTNNNLLPNKLKNINIKKDLLFLKKNNLITNKKNKNFNVIFSNFLMYYASYYNSLLSINKIKKKLHFHNNKIYFDNVHRNMLFPVNDAILLSNKNNYYKYNISTLLKCHEYSFFFKKINTFLTSNILLDKKQNYINDNPYKIYKKTLTILDDNINFCKKIELFNDDIINNHKLLIHNITFKDNKKYILVYSADITPFLNKITKMKKNFFHTAFDVYNYFHINMNITDTINILKKSLISDKINMNNTLLLQINILKSNNVFQETINKKLLTIIMNACFLINFQEHKGCIDCIFLKLKINYKEKTAKISIFSKNYALCIALKESLISLKNTFNKYNFQLKNIIIKNNDCFKNKNYDDNNNFINQRSFFSIIINNNKNIQDSVIRNKIYFQNKYFTSNVIDIYA